MQDNHTELSDEARTMELETSLDHQEPRLEQELTHICRKPGRRHFCCVKSKASPVPVDGRAANVFCPVELPDMTPG